MPGNEHLASDSAAPLQFDPQQMRDNFDRQPFVVRHTLTQHPLLQLPRIMELARALPASSVEYNAGDLPVNQDPDLTPRHGLHRLLGGGILNLQQTGDNTLDEITVEYGGLLVRRGCETLAYAALLERLAQADLVRNDLYIPASSHRCFVQAALPPRWQMRSIRQRGCYVVDLAAIRESGNSYLQHLSASTRSGLRQTRRTFEPLGDIRLSVADDAVQALAWLEQLRELHQRRWHDAGHHGAFGQRLLSCLSPQPDSALSRQRAAATQPAVLW